MEIVDVFFLSLFLYHEKNNGSNEKAMNQLAILTETIAN